jgi:CBS domain-containing protein
MSNLIYTILPKPMREIVSIHPDLTVSQCLEIMVSRSIGALVVTDDDNLMGIVSERDIVWGLLHNKMEIMNKPASDILWANVAVLKPTDTVETAMVVITKTKRRHVLIAEEGKLIAIVSIGDILCSLLDEKDRVIEHLENYIHQ